MIRVLIVEDQKMAQENMEDIIRSSESYTLAGIIPNAADTELFCMRGNVDLILMDVCTARDENGIEACAVIKRKFPRIKIRSTLPRMQNSSVSAAFGMMPARV